MPERLVIFSGPSGCGKDTVLRAWRKVNPRVRKVTAYTTRSPREGEISGVDYHFVSRDTFLKMVEDGAFLEHKEVHGNLYGTPLKGLESILRDGAIAVLKIDVQGGMEVMKKRPDAISIMLMPPSMKELERRIRNRETDSEDAIRLRLKNAIKEMEFADEYQHCVINDKVEQAVRELEKIVA